MKTPALLLFSAVFAAAPSPNDGQTADSQFLKKQGDLLRLFSNVQQPSLYPEEQQQASNFNFRTAIKNSNNAHAVGVLQGEYLSGLLPKERAFNFLNRVHRRQAIELFDLFYFAKDYDNFYQAACWARNNVNPGMFIYAFSVAILNRPDTQGVALPPIAEIFPYLYVNVEALQQAQNSKQRGQKEVQVQSNVTSKYFDSYINEDVNLNQQFAYEQFKNPSWFGGDKYQQGKYQKNKYQNNGENYLYYLQQLLARYNLEKQSNKLTPVFPLDLNKFIFPGYNPELQYANGQAVPARSEHSNIYSNADAKLLQQFLNMDRRIADAVDSNQALAVDGSRVPLSKEDGIRVLGNIIQNNQESVNNQFYGSNIGQFGYLDQCRKVVGSVIDPYGTYNTAPAIVESDFAANRDQAFYQCVARTVSYFETFKEQLKPYTADQLTFQGVKVLNVKTDKLVTFIDKSEVDLLNALSYNDGEKPEEFRFKAEQQKLNYKPFNYLIQVNSDKETNAIVRVFIGPKYTFIAEKRDLEGIRKALVEIDRFTIQLKNGQNQIKRNSKESTRFVKEQPSTRQLYKQIEQAYNTKDFYLKNFNDQPAAFPQNLILPRGQDYGQEFLFVVAVHSYQGNSQAEDQQPEDNRAQGFPFDRVVYEDNYYQSKNILFKTVQVFRQPTQRSSN